jgi:predicted nucleic acid-binding protein
MPVVANSSPLIYFAALGDFHFLRDLFAPVIIPPAVYHEVVEQGAGFPVKREVEKALGDWLSIGTIQNRMLVDRACSVGKLDIGESEAIALAEEAGAEKLLLEIGARSITRASSGLP